MERNAQCVDGAPGDSASFVRGAWAAATGPTNFFEWLRTTRASCCGCWTVGVAIAPRCGAPAICCSSIYFTHYVTEYAQLVEWDALGTDVNGAVTWSNAELLVGAETERTWGTCLPNNLFGDTIGHVYVAHPSPIFCHRTNNLWTLSIIIEANFAYVTFLLRQYLPTNVYYY